MEMLAILEAMALASSCSVDAFAASFAYGSKRIRIPFLSNQIVNLLCSSILGVSLWLGAFVRQYLPDGFAAVICFTILFVLGLSKLLDSLTKSIIRKHRKNGGLCKEIRFSLFSVRCILNLYADPEIADADENKIISSPEAALLAVSLSLDGLAVGFGAGMGSVSIPVVVITSLVTNMLAIYLGSRLGEGLSRKLPFNLSWLSGVILIVLAVAKLL